MLGRILRNRLGRLLLRLMLFVPSVMLYLYVVEQLPENYLLQIGLAYLLIEGGYRVFAAMDYSVKHENEYIRG